MTMCEYGSMPMGKTNDQLKIEKLEREAQQLRSANARYKMEVQLAHFMLEDSDYEKTIGDVEHETELHDKIEAVTNELKQYKKLYEQASWHLKEMVMGDDPGKAWDEAQEFLNETWKEGY